MAKFHISQNGEPKPCRALKNCPLGGDTPHGEFANVKEAQAWAEKVLEVQLGNALIAHQKSDFKPLNSANVSYGEVSYDMEEEYSTIVKTLADYETARGATWNDNDYTTDLTDLEGNKLISIHNDTQNVSADGIMQKHPGETISSRLAHDEAMEVIRESDVLTEDVAHALDRLQRLNKDSYWVTAPGSYQLVKADKSVEAIVWTEGVVDFF